MRAWIANIELTGCYNLEMPPLEKININPEK